MPSIVIPAHDEERSIAELLLSLAPLAATTEVVVACNGCHDQTVAVACRTAPWAQVLDLPEPSKPAALDAADAAATTFPRLYLDADVSITAEAVQALFDALDGDLLAAAATPSYDTTRSSLIVRSHHRFWEALPVNRQALSGTNAMAVSAQGRARFEHWPRLIGDDYFLDGLFAPHEKARIAAAPVVRPASRRFADTISRRARIRQGNDEVVAAGLRPPHTGGGSGGAMATLRDDPRLVVHLPAHVAVVAGTRVLTQWRRRRGTAGTWYRDQSRA